MAPKYKVGDHVILLDGSKKGEKAIITEVFDYVYYIDVYTKGQRKPYSYSRGLELDKEYYRDKKINDILDV